MISNLKKGIILRVLHLNVLAFLVYERFFLFYFINLKMNTGYDGFPFSMFYNQPVITSIRGRQLL